MNGGGAAAPSLGGLGRINEDGRMMVDGGFHPNGEELLLIDGGSSAPFRWSIAERAFRPFPVELPAGFVAGKVAWSEDGTRCALAGCSEDGDRVFLLDAGSYAVLEEMKEEAGVVMYFLGFCPGRPLLVSGHEHTIDFWWLDRSPPRKKRRRPDYIDGPRCAAFTSDGRFLVIRDLTHGLRCLDVETWEETRHPQVGKSARSVHAGTSGSEVLVVHADRRVERWDVAAGERRSSITFDAEHGPTSFDPSRSLAATSEPVEREQLTLFDAARGSVLSRAPLATRGDHTHEAFSRDGRLLLTIGYDTSLFEVVRP